jgi:hypothetical protein
MNKPKRITILGVFVCVAVMAVLGVMFYVNGKSIDKTGNRLDVMVGAGGARILQDDEDDDDANEAFTDTFAIESCEFASTGRNPFFILEPGHQLVLAGEDDGEQVRLVITVLNEVKVVDGVETRVVEERETKDGELVEVSRNYFAICAKTNSVFYFGEDVDIYEDGRIVSHDGAWQAGTNGARPGIIMPGTVLLGARYFQEVAPDVAMDRAEVESLTRVVQTPAGRFMNVLETEETTPLEPNAEGFKYYAAGIGLIKDGPLELIRVTRQP